MDIFKKVGDYIKTHPEVVVLSAVIAVQTAMMYKAGQRVGSLETAAAYNAEKGYEMGYIDGQADFAVNPPLSQDTQEV